jgi:hypothetical protein
MQNAYAVAAAVAALVVLLTTFVVFTGFMVAAGYKRTIAASVKISRARYVISLFWFLVGVPADAVYNLTVGTVVFRQLPRFSIVWKVFPIPELYSGRVQRNVTRADWRGELARAEAAFLNANIDGHIKL